MNRQEGEICRLAQKVFNPADNIKNYLSFLTNLGENTRSERIKYSQYEHYKQLFQYCIIKEYNIERIFFNTDFHYQYNTILVTLNKENIDKMCTVITHFIRNTNDIACIFVDIKWLFGKYGYHTTLLIYNPHLNEITHFDPNGPVNEKNKHLLYLLKKVEFMNFHIKFISSDESFPIKKDTPEEKSARAMNNVACLVRKSEGGWCQIFSLLLYELSHKYPSLSTTSILKHIYEDYIGKTFKIAANGFYNLIRGFYIHMYNKLDYYLSKKGFNISKEMLDDYNPQYVVSDIKIQASIYEELKDKIIFSVS